MTPLCWSCMWRETTQVVCVVVSNVIQLRHHYKDFKMTTELNHIYLCNCTAVILDWIGFKFK